ncbi:nitrile hydratase subunit beta [Dongia sp. agr-C8]
MNTVHDMGGMDGFGPIARETEEPVFHAEWERRMFALAFGIAVAVPKTEDDHFRREIESLPPVTYLKASYYELWYRAYSAMLRRHGLLGAAAASATAPTGLNPPLTAEQVRPAIEGGASTRMPDEGIVARFKAGDAVTARNIHPTGHTRLPRYARGKRGVIHADRGVFSFADSKARGDGPCPQHLYTVAFTAETLWGAGGHADKVYLDLWDAYLDPAISD